MIDKTLLTETVAKAIADTDLFIVSINITSDNNITVTLDSPSGVDIDQCVRLTREIEATFDRDIEDYELEVGSAGLTAPMTVLPQFKMNIGNPVEILTRDGRKLHATLTDVTDDLSAITVTVPTKVKEPGAKRPTIQDIPETINLDNVKYITREIIF
ncbi:MAG: ribosome assembly cofactor RimP [Muribaculaceae bacterium]|nr:ribosome assembly cofactor RimP [Muribaculaceae bacterium]